MNEKYEKIKKTNKASGIIFLVLLFLNFISFVTAPEGSGMALAMSIIISLPIFLIVIAIYITTFFELEKIRKNNLIEDDNKLIASKIIRAIILGVAIFITFIILLIIDGICFH